MSRSSPVKTLRTRATEPFSSLPRARPSVCLAPVTAFLSTTMSFFRMRICYSFSSLHDFSREGNDLHEVLLAKLARHSAENARPLRVPIGVNDHQRVPVE